MGANAKLYDRDFYAWTREQATLLREGRLAEADLENLAEEIESMGRSEKREIVSRLIVLLSHLAKWRYQPELRSRSWGSTIRDRRADLLEWLEENPSLRAQIDAFVTRAWLRAVRLAGSETGLGEGAFPQHCPWTAAQALDDAFWPE